MVQAKITVTMTTQEFDALRWAIERTYAAELASANDSENTHKERADARARCVSMSTIREALR